MKFFFLIISSCLSIFTNAQINTNSQWTWIKGDNIPNVIGVYGTQGVAAAANKPGSRPGSISWIDLSGNFWLLGGYGLDPGSINIYNDLWKYNTTNNQWTWMKGDNIVNQIGVYGTQGVAAAANKPGSRAYGVSWTDVSGDL